MSDREFWKFARDVMGIDKSDRDPLYSVSFKSASTQRACRKCGSTTLSVRYRRDGDELACKCLTCEYNWREAPRDKAPNAKAT